MDFCSIPRGQQFLFPSSRRFGQPISYSFYRSIIKKWAAKLGLNADYYGTNSMRRTKATLIYARTKNIRVVQILLGHSKLDNTIRYLCVELEGALRLSEKTECWQELKQAFLLKSLCPIIIQSKSSLNGRLDAFINAIAMLSIMDDFFRNPYVESPTLFESLVSYTHGSYLMRRYIS